MEKSTRLRGKDQITIGIFTAIYFVLSLGSNISGGLHPMAWILSPVLAAVLGATPFMIMVTKVRKPFAVLMMGIVVALIYFIMGQFPITMPIAFVVGAIIAEFIRKITGYDKFWGNALGYSFFSLGMTGSPLPIWVYRESFFAQIREFGMPEAYINSLEKLASPGMLAVMIILTLIAGLLGAQVSKKLFSKHFTKAGIV